MSKKPPEKNEHAALAEAMKAASRDIKDPLRPGESLSSKELQRDSSFLFSRPFTKSKRG